MSSCITFSSLFFTLRSFLMFGFTNHQEFFQFEELQEWFDNADAFIFVGTSFSVTLTSLALQVARSKSIPMFNFNLEKDEEKAASKTLKWSNVCGKAEVLLPRLVDLVKRKQNEATRNNLV
jgi:NAD-dependent SIR2 family protein deacetylase